jgi:hypothetical protein
MLSHESTKVDVKSSMINNNNNQSTQSHHEIDDLTILFTSR